MHRSARWEIEHQAGALVAKREGLRLADGLPHTAGQRQSERRGRPRRRRRTRRARREEEGDEEEPPQQPAWIVAWGPGSQAAAESILDASAIGATQRDVCAVLQPDAIVAVQIRHQLRDAVEADDARAVHA